MTLNLIGFLKASRYSDYGCLWFGGHTGYLSNPRNTYMLQHLLYKSFQVNKVYLLNSEAMKRKEIFCVNLDMGRKPVYSWVRHFFFFFLLKCKTYNSTKIETRKKTCKNKRELKVEKTYKSLLNIYSSQKPFLYVFRRLSC